MCKLPAEKQHIYHNTPQTKYYGICFKGENGVYRVARIVDKDLARIGIAAMNHQELGDKVIAGIPPRLDLLKSRHIHGTHLQLLVESLINHYHDLETLSPEEMKAANIEVKTPEV